MARPLTPPLPYTRSADAPRLAVVIDIDETLLCSENRRGSNAAMDGYETHDIDTGVRMVRVALRPWARRLLHHLEAQHMDLYLLTAGSSAYCRSIVELFNRLATDAGCTPPLRGGAAARDDDDKVVDKYFEMVLPDDHPVERALGVDNMRKGWCHKHRDHIVIVPDWIPGRHDAARDDALLGVFERIMEVAYCMDMGAQHAGDTLAELYETDIKEFMDQRPPRTAFVHPNHIEPGSFVEALCARRSA